MLPLCEMPIRRPGTSASRSSAALTVRPIPSAQFTMPMLFGPRMRVFEVRAISVSRCCLASPSGPASENPSARIETTGTPAAAQASTAPMTAPVPTQT